MLPIDTFVRQQYVHREKLFTNPNILPKFILQTYRSVVSHGGSVPSFPTWFDALDKMTSEIAALDFDIAIIGSGAYGMSLSAEIKQSGRKPYTWEVLPNCFSA